MKADKMTTYEDKGLASWWDAFACTEDPPIRRHLRICERDRRRDKFLDGHGLRQSKARLSVAKVAGRRICPPGFLGAYDLWRERDYYPRALGWFDHTELFFGPSGYVLTTQPYDLTIEKLSALESLCFELGIAATVFVGDGWHYPGRCPLVVLHKGELRSVGK